MKSKLTFFSFAIIGAISSILVYANIVSAQSAMGEPLTAPVTPPLTVIHICGATSSCLPTPTPKHFPSTGPVIPSLKPVPTVKPGSTMKPVPTIGPIVRTK